MNISPVGNPLLHAATLAVQKQGQAAPKSPDAPDAPAADNVTLQTPRAITDEATGAVTGQLRTPDELEQLADDVLAIFEDSPDQLEQLVATLKRLEGNTAS